MAEEKKTARKFKEVETNYAEPWEPKAEKDFIEGKYVGFDNIPSDRRSTSGQETFRSYRILQDGKDRPMGVAGAMLGSKLPQVPIGSFVRITYIGQTKTGGGMAKDFKVDVEEGVKLLRVDQNGEVF